VFAKFGPGKASVVAFPGQWLPLLKDVSSDEHLPLIARNRARRLIKQIEKQSVLDLIRFGAGSGFVVKLSNTVGCIYLSEFPLGPGDAPFAEAEGFNM
jgi:hypothetical protein